jgi:hypothetical protein
LDLAYERSLTVAARDADRGTALDAKAVQIFSAASIAFGLGDWLTTDTTEWRLWTFRLAVVALAMAAVSCFRAYQPRPFMVGPDRELNMSPDRLRESPEEYRMREMEDIRRAHEYNRVPLQEKATLVATALGCLIAEMLFLAASVLR